MTPIPTTTNEDNPRGFLPPETTTTGNRPHPHLPGFTTLLLPNKSPTCCNDVVSCTTSQDSQQQLVNATSLAHAIFKLRDALATTNTHNSGNYKSSMITSSCSYDDDKQHTITSLDPSRPTTLSDSISTGPHHQKTTAAKKPPLTGVKTTCLDPSQESPHIKRMKKMAEMVKEMEKKCMEFKSECESQDYIQDHNIPPCKVIAEQDQVKEESVRFKRLDDGSTSIRLSCSCGKSFEMLHNHSGSFYRLM